MTRRPIVRYTASTTEADLLQAFQDVADIHPGGGLLWHVRDARGQNVAGLTDTVLLVPPVVAFYEIKTQYDPVSPLQRQVLELLSRCTRIEHGIVRPIPHEGELSEDDALELLR
jgi:hypothetical protein